MQTTTWQQFYKSFLQVLETTPSYRLGQHFMNMFIYDTSEFTCDEACKGLWNKTGDQAFTQCFEIINKYQWDVENLPLVDRSK
ncbi:hypothetical protein VPBG_00038 [Vibrio phage helene 12B3]|uniref:hypothetical protein n=1 Tax=Vibrio phage helene 12B3 TaxID=573173 RepID=UPI0002C0DDC5|nr:hypothetical protein VPBG_00038 [Vibrio phage helene 12B3]AGG57810.1 hypothetical protein VPBG_00038 [Vibrio phage helene 12B3]